MDNKRKNEILYKQLELLAEASKVCRPEDLPELTTAMVMVSQEL